MKGDAEMKILVYDSGIAKSQNDYIKTTDLGFGTIDEAKHGSVVCDIIRLLSPNSEIESVKILDKNNTTTLEVLIEALKYGIDSDCDVICLALSVECEEDCIPLHNILANMDNKGKIIICSNMNRREYSFPAAYENVIGCRIQYNSSDYRLFVKDRLIKSSLPVLAVWRRIENEGFVCLNGNSLACAIMTGEIAYISNKSNISGRKQIEKLLSDMEWEDYQFFKHTRSVLNMKNMQNKNEISDKIKKVIEKYNVDMTKPLYFSGKIEAMLNDIFSEQKIINTDSVLQPSNVENIDSLTNYICNSIT